MPFVQISENLLYHSERMWDMSVESKQLLDSFLRSHCNFMYPGDVFIVCWISDLDGNVFSVLTALDSNLNGTDIIEIHNVCVAKEYRRQGFGITLLKNVIQQFKDIPLWLGVEFWNMPAFNLYVNLGFSNPIVSYVTPSGNPYPDGIISLMYLGEKSFLEKQYVLNLIELIHQQNFG